MTSRPPSLIWTRTPSRKRGLVMVVADHGHRRDAQGARLVSAALFRNRHADRVAVRLVDRLELKVTIYIAILLWLAWSVSGCVLMIPMAAYGIAKAVHEHQECERTPDR